MQVDSEEPVFEAVINWVKHSKKEREASLPELLQYVRMPLLTPRYITDVIDTEVRYGTAASGAGGHCVLLAGLCCPTERIQGSPLLLLFDGDTVELSLLSRSAAVTLSSGLLCQQSQHPALQPQGALSRAISQLSLQISTAPFRCHLLQSPTSAFCLHS